MAGPEVMFPEEQQQMTMVCQRLARDANAKAVLLIGRDGQPIADAGDVDELDVTSLVFADRGQRRRDGRDGQDPVARRNSPASSTRARRLTSTSRSWAAAPSWW